LKQKKGLKQKWWSDHEMALPSWSTSVKKILLVQPSSASAERVFSFLHNAFNRQQDAALEETACRDLSHAKIQQARWLKHTQ
jgi:squalene cyclase